MKARTIRRTAAAEDDLLEIWRTIAADNPAAADRVLDAIERKCQLLAMFPEAGPARDDIAPGLRYLVQGSYLILYRVAGSRVLIARVVHGRRQLKGLPT